jgi:hypothetical protein
VIFACKRSEITQIVLKEVRLTALGAKEREEGLRKVKMLGSLKHLCIVE